LDCHKKNIACIRTQHAQECHIQDEDNLVDCPHKDHGCTTEKKPQSQMTEHIQACEYRFVKAHTQLVSKMKLKTKKPKQHIIEKSHGDAEWYHPAGKVSSSTDTGLSYLAMS
jgi:hypothetical protein